MPQAAVGLRTVSGHPVSHWSPIGAESLIRTPYMSHPGYAPASIAPQGFRCIEARLDWKGCTWTHLACR